MLARAGSAIMSGQLNTGGGYAGHSSIQTPGGSVSVLDHLVREIVAGKAFAAIVKVLSVSGGGLGQPPFVSVQPMVDQIDGDGKRTPHGTIYNIPCFRLQGMYGAVVLDPGVGEIGQAIICDRDISTVKTTRQISGPGSRRHNDWADGCYFGGFLNTLPTQYVAMDAAGVRVVSPTQISLMVGSMGVVINPSGTIIDGKTFLPHTHGDPQGGNTGGVS